MIVSTIEDALELILDWAGRSDVIIPPRSSAATQPRSIAPLVAVSDFLGPEFYAAYNVTSPLLNVQDEIKRPEDQHIRDGVRLLGAENQGLWLFGYREAAPDDLLVSGDWFDQPSTQNRESWRSVSATTEDALITLALSNAFFALCGRYPFKDTGDFTSVPAETDILVWRHSAGEGWLGFWTNAAGTLLHFGGMGQTVSRAQ